MCCSCVWCFFFFKQKTAYEMRISDWSSDVCSSDLRWGGGLPQYAVGHLDRVARIRASVASVPGLAVCGAAYDGIGIPAVIASAMRAVADLTEIGRASCRERVCQYV